MIINLEFSRVSKITFQKNIYKNFLFQSGIKMISLSPEESKVITKLRKVKGYKYKFKDELMKILSEP